MTDTDNLSLRNQVAMLTALAALLDYTQYPPLQGMAKSLDTRAKRTLAHLGDEERSEPPLQSLTDAVRATTTRPWPDDVAAAGGRAGKEEEP